VPKLAAQTDKAEADVLGCMNFAAAYRPKLHSSNSIKRLAKEIK
jgi:hypothetical protein